MRRLYTLCLTLALPLILLRLWRKSLREPAYKNRWSERFGHLPFPPQKNALWIHAASLGETNALAPFIEALQKKFPGRPLILTCMTPSGSQRITELHGDRVQHAYVPYDLPFFLKRFIKHCNPTQLILMETELWPNMIDQCNQNQIPIMVINARLSENAYRNYRRAKIFIKNMLQQLTLVAAQDEDNGERFLKLGLDKNKLQIIPNLKFDINVPDTTAHDAQHFKERLGKNRPLWIAASTHPGEDEIVFAAHQIILQQRPNALLVLVPRHCHRSPAITQLAQSIGLTITLDTDGTPVTERSQVFLCDTPQALLPRYAAAEVAFVGGSLTPIGGHNILEPAAVGTPVLTGPHMHNFKAITQLFLEADAALQVTDAASLAQAVLRLLEDKTDWEAQSKRASALLEQHKGAVARYVALTAAL